MSGPSLAPEVRAYWKISPTSVKVHRLIAVFNGAFGIVLLAGGEQRVDTPSLAIIRDYGGPYLWGVAYIVIAAWIGASPCISGRSVLRSEQGVALLHVMLAASLYAAVIAQGTPERPNEPHAAWIGIPAFLFIAAIHFLCASAYKSLLPPRTSPGAEGEGMSD